MTETGSRADEIRLFFLAELLGFGTVRIRDQVEIRRRSARRVLFLSRPVESSAYNDTIRTSKRSWRLPLKSGAYHAAGDGPSFPLKRALISLKRSPNQHRPGSR